MKKVLYSSICISLLFLLVTCALKPKSNIDKRVENKSSLSLSSDLYKVANIKLVGKAYLIYASRNDSIFEIVSEKTEDSSCGNIKIGQLYGFKIQSQLENKTSPFYTLRSNRLLVTHVNLYGTLIPLEAESRYDLYVDNRLKNLCLKIGSD